MKSRLKIVKGLGLKWRRIRPGLYRLTGSRYGGEIERGAETGMWYMLKFNAKTGKEVACTRRVTLKAAKASFDGFVE